MLPPNATSIMQPLDQGIILSAKRRYKKKLAERYLACVENNKDANSLLKALNIVQATNMIASSWRETSSTIIQNCFRKAGFKHHAVDPASETEEDPLPAPAPDVWNRVQRWLGDMQFDEFVASEPEAATAQPMSDQEIVNIVLTVNDAQDESDDESEEEILILWGQCHNYHTYILLFNPPPPRLMCIGFSIITSLLTAPTSIGSCSCSSFISCLNSVGVGVGVGVGVVCVFTY